MLVAKVIKFANKVKAKIRMLSLNLGRKKAQNAKVSTKTTINSPKRT